MTIDLSSFIEKDEKVYQFKGEVKEGSNEIDYQEFQVIFPVFYQATIYKIDGVYTINVDVNYRYRTKCARCLEKTEKEITTSFNARLEEESSETTEEDHEIIYFKDDILELDKYVLMEVSSSLPMKTLCTDTCKGICPQCGTDLNKENCDCKIEFTDPRFEKLKDLFADD